MYKKICIKYKKRNINVIADDCNLLKKTIGLMFSRRENAKILLFSFRKKQKIAIHSFFVFYPFLAVWLDEKNEIVNLKVVKSFIPYASSRKKCLRLVEIPINNKNKRILALFRR
jgi:uncharacterized membrane protein (UPF0127 family)